MAAGPGQYVVSTQPQSQMSVENGEQIVMEAVCDSENIQKATCNRFFWAGAVPMMAAGLLPGLCWCAIGIPLSCYLGHRAADSWRLYLAHKHCFALPGAEKSGLRVLFKS